MKPIVAIVGRPNVGKSRFFNRLTESQDAIVFDFEGVTRDRQYGDAEWYGREFTLIDTGGFVPTTEEPLLALMRDQARLAIEEADIILFVMDGRAGLLPGDREIANLLREVEKPVFYIVNKVDSPQKSHEFLADFYELGKDLYAVSAEHGPGMDALMDEVAEYIPREPDEIAEDDPFCRIAVVGKPNAGKSSTVNALLGETRLLTSDIPGTTRDAVDTYLEGEDGKLYQVIDTAGLRRKSSISEKLEEFSVVQAIRSIDRADVALLVIDAAEGITAQDKKIASVVNNRGRGCVIVVNKWDLITEKTTETAGWWVKEIRYHMPFVAYAPVIFTSALTGKRVNRLLPLVDEVFEQYTKRIKTADVNRFLEGVMAKHSPPLHRNRRLKFFYAAQVATRPPTFVFVVNYKKGIAASYRRFLENQIREQFDFEGTPIRTVVRERKRRESPDDPIYS